MTGYTSGRFGRALFLLVLLVFPLVFAGCGEEYGDPAAPFNSQVVPRTSAPAANDVLYDVNSSTDGLSIIDPVSGAVTFIGPLDPDPTMFTTPVAMAVRPSDNKLFVWNNSDPPWVLLTVDPCTGLGTIVDRSTPPQNQLGALAFAPDGTLFGLDRSLYEVDTATGVLTLIGAFGTGIIMAAADFDASGTLFAVDLVSDRLVTVNTATAALGNIGVLTPDIGLIGSIVFDASGTLIGSADTGSEVILFDIDPTNAMVSNVRSLSVLPGPGDRLPQGMGFAPACRAAAALDIKPGSCPNPINPKSRGVLPTAILGTPDFDVRDIDVSSLLLEGVAPLRSKVADVATPVIPGTACECTTDGPDGFDDLTLKFKTQDIVNALGTVFRDDVRVLTITGNLLDGTRFEASDCVVIVGPPGLQGDHPGKFR